MTEFITEVSALEELYGRASPRSLEKVVTQITPLYAKWIESSRFCVLTTVGPEGTDGSPRGDDGPVVRIADPSTLMLPDWMGNNRMDSLRNIVRDGRVSLMFMVPGSENVVRVNGTAKISADPDLTATFDQRGKHPRSVIVISVGEVYFQCAKALMRSRLWSGEDETAGLPTAGDLVKEVDPEFDATVYDREYAEYAQGKMW
ncbi:pyridoxamine 5'-phosphate oxidase family protein [Pelagovum pacificum]|uniref:Pyridoxamine 5'-phosphate oxidase family protein n=1 Tax=Pelagovum pacificum TaxID=2588711 RepID=A0A5C5GBY4_9RHOB|nr:pyridoxamine 5'-phosphate oxidase family protein [Pelagovum pacificum]QQA42398.1 pyridoxamine 5'-phosphate oxidase family protein [Pelagovum pacificum]TNY31480.1 pyridoxamine 5'-phosphate oxidase family protein [Pelagovum pacificum]